MAKAYTIEEKENIKQRIKEIGMQMFKAKGLKKARIEELTKEVGISLGGFYTFYKNKEELFIELVKDIEDNMHNKILEEIKNTDNTPEEFIKKTAFIICKKMDENKMFMNTQSDITKLINEVDEEQIKDGLEKDIALIESAKELWKEKGYNIDTPAIKILGMFKCLTTLRANSAMIGEGIIDELCNHMLDKFIEEYISKPTARDGI